VGDIAKVTADELGFSHRVLELDRTILETALNIIIEDGYPKNAINFIHKNVIETLAREDAVSAIADGVRRDDRVPRLTDAEIRSIEDRFGVNYICPLQGYGRSAVNMLVEKHLVIDEGQSDSIVKADYETELRELIRQQYGNEKVIDIFPQHVQSRVLRRI
jgi:hypothetical protein